MDSTVYLRVAAKIAEKLNDRFDNKTGKLSLGGSSWYVFKWITMWLKDTVIADLDKESMAVGN